MTFLKIPKLYTELLNILNHLPFRVSCDNPMEKERIGINWQKIILHD